MQGNRFVSRLSDRPFFHLALIGVAVASLTLAGCGRKGPLDPPPGASMAGSPQDQAQVVSPGVDQTAPIAGQPRDTTAFDPQVPRGPAKRIFLDGLLN
jgi:predicted small lipoprotein YifL